MARPTLKDIARLSGVSVATVSHVLGKRAHLFKKETRDRVLAAAKKLGYMPSATARAMRAGRLGSVALLLSTVQDRSSLPAQLLDGIFDALRERDLQLTVAKLPDEELVKEGFVPKVLREWAVDGLLVNYTHRIPRRMIRLIREHAVPAVWVNMKAERDAVYPDDLSAGRLVTEHLIELGHERTAFVTYSHKMSPGEHYSVFDRCEGYEEAAREAGLKPRRILRPRGASARDVPRATADWLTAGDGPTAVVCYGDTTASVVLAAALAGGLRVPGDLSVATFGDEAVTVGGLGLATAIIPKYEVGRAAVEMLEEKLGGQLSPSESRVVAPRFEPGAPPLFGSSAAPGADGPSAWGDRPGGDDAARSGQRRCPDDAA